MLGLRSDKFRPLNSGQIEPSLALEWGDVSRFFTPEFFADPYPTYEELRAKPVRWEEELNGWLLTGYAEVAGALADPRVSRGSGPQEVICSGGCLRG